MSPYLKPLQQPNRLSAHGKYRTPPRDPVPETITATEQVECTWDIQNAAPCP
ncbi:hypothetical protein AVEN_81680-1, partial [Araneus ventricosus]